MNILKQSNLQYNSNIPYFVGDRRYGQDIVRDQQSLLSRMGAVIRGLTGQDNFLLSGGTVSEGSTKSLIDITEIYAILKASVEVPDNFSTLPPTKKSEDIIMPTYLESQSDLSLSTATLDGITTNYIKISYQEVDGQTRQRAKKTGTYAYEVQPSILITVDTTSPTSYEVVIATLVGNGSSVLTITPIVFEYEISNIITDNIIADSATIVNTTSEILQSKNHRQQLPSSIATLGNSFTLPTALATAKDITALSTSRIVYVWADIGGFFKIGTYDFDGTDWTLVGNIFTTPVANGSDCAICSLSNSRVLLNGNSSLSTYDFDGTDWTLVGNIGSVTGSDGGVTSLSSTRIACAIWNGSAGTPLIWVRVYDFDGTDWTLVSTTISIPSTAGVFPDICALTSNTFLVISGEDQFARIYAFNDGALSQVGNSLVTTGTDNNNCCALSDNTALVLNNGNDTYEFYRIANGEATYIGDPSTFVLAEHDNICTLDYDRVVYLNSTAETIQAYTINFVSGPPNPAFGTL